MTLSVDPIEAMLAADAADDHARARARGRRVLDLCDGVIEDLVAAGVTLDPAAARVAIYHTLADGLYGVTTAIDIPDLRGAR